MSYIGRGTESISNVEVLDNLTFNGSASYTLQKSSVNFVPSSANNLLISISGVVQQGNFSVSGSTITFDTTVSASDTCDWILHYGTGLITTVADGAITEAKLGNNAVTASKIDSSVALGKIGQVVNSTVSYSQLSTSASFVDMNSASSTVWETSITPTSTSSKILVLGSLSVNGYNNAAAEGRGSVKAFYKIGSNSYTQYKEYYENVGGYDYGNSGIWVKQSLGLSSLLSLSTTSAVTFKFQMRTGGAINFNNGTSDSQLTLMEVLA